MHDGAVAVAAAGAAGASAQDAASADRGGQLVEPRAPGDGLPASRTIVPPGAMHSPPLPETGIQFNGISVPPSLAKRGAYRHMATR